MLSDIPREPRDEILRLGKPIRHQAFNLHARIDVNSTPHCYFRTHDRGIVLWTAMRLGLARGRSVPSEQRARADALASRSRRVPYWPV